MFSHNFVSTVYRVPLRLKFTGQNYLVEYTSTQMYVAKYFPKIHLFIKQWIIYATDYNMKVVVTYSTNLITNLQFH